MPTFFEGPSRWRHPWWYCEHPTTARKPLRGLAILVSSIAAVDHVPLTRAIQDGVNPAALAKQYDARFGGSSYGKGQQRRTHGLKRHALHSAVSTLHCSVNHSGLEPTRDLHRKLSSDLGAVSAGIPSWISIVYVSCSAFPRNAQPTLPDPSLFQAVYRDSFTASFSRAPGLCVG